MQFTKSFPICLSGVQSKILNEIVCKRRSAYDHMYRAQIILAAAAKKKNARIAKNLKKDRATIIKWRKRWFEYQDRLNHQEKESNLEELFQMILDLLSDAPRPGAPPKFTAEEISQIIAVALEKPTESNRPISHWTPRELADEVIQREIVESISPTQVDRFLKSAGFKTPSNRVLVGTEYKR